MYVDPNCKTKAALKIAVKAGFGVTVFSPGPFGHDVADGDYSVEGPHYPEPHRWYARVRVVAGFVERVLS